MSEPTAGWDDATSVERARAAVAPPAQQKTAALPPVTVTQPRAAPPSVQNVERPKVSLAARLTEISPAATRRLAEKFKSAGASWPPAEAALVAVKDARTLELHALGANGAWVFVHSYPVLAASGAAGPKLRKGDKQVPEGVYKISFLNPNSKYHVAMRVNYPNDFDRQMAAKDGRKELGGDIMIHGKAVSIGCLAVGDEAAEELFVLSDKIGLPHMKLVIAPSDFRRDGVPAPKAGDPAWLPQLYAQLATEMAAYQAPPQSGIAGLLSYFGK